MIAILDDGVEVEHPDLKPNPARNLCFDFLDAYAKGYNPEDKDDPSPTITIAELLTTNIPKEKLWFLNGAHGTNVSGVAAARHNGIGIYGIAPKSGIAGYRLLGIRVEEGKIVPTKWEKFAKLKALKLNKDKIHIYNNSRRWGNACRRAKFPQKLKDELKNTALEGRIFVSGAANDRECKGDSNYNPWANSRYTITVAASGKSRLSSGQ